MPTLALLNSPIPLGRSVDGVSSLPPLGLAYICTQAMHQGLTAHIVDGVAEALSPTECANRVLALDPDYVGTNVFTTNTDEVRSTLVRLPRDLPIMIGGAAAPFLRDEIVSWRLPAPVTIVAGDGELVAPSLVQGDVRLARIPIGAGVDLVEALPGSPWFAESIDLPLDRAPLVSSEPRRHPSLGICEAHISTTRGCVNDCAFCAAARSVHPRVRPRRRTVGHVRHELVEIRRLFPEVNAIRVVDDLFLVNNRSIAHAGAVFQGQGLRWRAMAHVRPLTTATMQRLDALRSTGCWEVSLGLESGSEQVLRRINKPHSRGDAECAVRRLLDAGISVKGYFLLGTPGETAEEMDLTYTLASELRSMKGREGACFRCSVFKYRPYHGTRMYRELLAAGRSLGPAVCEAGLGGGPGRDQFHLSLGNFSQVKDEVLNEYVCRISSIDEGA